MVNYKYKYEELDALSDQILVVDYPSSNTNTTIYIVDKFVKFYY